MPKRAGRIWGRKLWFDDQESTGETEDGQGDLISFNLFPDKEGGKDQHK
jgi:hypothetical protein